jgi:glycerophosphoryl diester phosphodiesterase
MSFSDHLQRYHKIILLILTIAFACLFQGYRFYTGDHTSQLPTVLHFYDNELYSKDYQMQLLNPWPVKVLPYLLVFVISKILYVPLPIVYFVSYLGLVYCFLLIVYKIAIELSPQPISGFMACSLILVFSQNSIMRSSSFNLIDPLVTARLVSTVLHVLCLFLVLRQKYYKSVIVAGFMYYFHGQNSIYSILPIISLAVLMNNRRKDFFKYLSLYLLVICLPLASLIIYFDGGSHSIKKYSLQEVTLMRAPHHIFPDTQLLLTMLFIIISLTLIFIIRQDKQWRIVSFWVFPLVCLYFLGVMNARIFYSDILTRMFCLRVDVFIRIIYFVLIAIIIDKTSRELFRKEFSTKILLNCLLLIAQIIFLTKIYLVSPLMLTLLKIAPPSNAFIEVADFVRRNTPKDTLVIAPPHLSGFRLYSQRSVVFDYKTNALGRGSKLQDEWMQRLLDICNVGKIEKFGWDFTKECEDGFRNLSPANVIALCRKYGADYFVTYSNPQMSAYESLVIYKNSQFILLKCPNEEGPVSNDFSVSHKARLARPASKLPRRIAHRGGSVRGVPKSNSLDALINSYDGGFRYFEVDLSLTSDQELVLIHDWTWAIERLFRAAPKVYSLEEFQQLKMIGGLKQVDGYELIKWMKKSPDAVIIADIKDDYLPSLQWLIKNYKDGRKNIIPQVFSFEQYEDVTNLGFKDVILSLYRSNYTDDEIVRFVKTHPFSAVCMPVERAQTLLPKKLKQLGVFVYAHTVNDPFLEARLKANGVDGVYTDMLGP